jgi:hypothetical protein
MVVLISMVRSHSSSTTCSASDMLEESYTAELLLTGLVTTAWSIFVLVPVPGDLGGVY